MYNSLSLLTQDMVLTARENKFPLTKFSNIQILTGLFIWFGVSAMSLENLGKLDTEFENELIKRHLLDNPDDAAEYEDIFSILHSALSVYHLRVLKTVCIEFYPPRLCKQKGAFHPFPTVD